MDDGNRNAATRPVDPLIEAYKKDVDRTLLRQNLRRTVEERLRAHQELLDFAAKWRGIARRHR